MAQPLDITPHLLSSLHLVRDGTVKIPLNLAWALDVKRVIDQRVLNTRKVPPDSMARRILIAHSCIEFWGNKKQPEEHRERRQSNDTPCNQIDLLRQLCFLSLVKQQPQNEVWSAPNASLRCIRSPGVARGNSAFEPADRVPSGHRQPGPPRPLEPIPSFPKFTTSANCRTA